MEDMSSENKWCSEIPCRLCADLCNRDDHLFLDENKCMVDLIEKYLSIKITMEDTLPTQVCEPCRMKLILFNEYALKCSTTQITLSSRSQECKDINTDLDNVKGECNIDIFDDMMEDSSIKSENEDDNLDQDIPKDKSTRKTPQVKEKLKIKSTKNKKNSARRKIKVIQSENAGLEVNLGELKFQFNGKSDKPKEPKPSSISRCSFINFTCHICNEEFLQWNSLKKHTNQIHKDIPKIMCICDKYLRSKKSIYTHIKRHDGDAFQHKCTQCSSSFYAERSLKRHFLSEHANATPPEYKCEHCGETFPKFHMLNQHKRKHLSNEVRNIRPCGICGKKSCGSLFQTLGPDTPKAPSPNIVSGVRFGSFNLPIADDAADLRVNCRELVFSRIHSSDTFKTNSNLQIHIDAVHNKEKSCVCDICGKAFSTKGGLKSHRTLHTVDRPYLCPHCPKTYKSNITLMRHKNIHDGITYKCSKCPSSFAYQTNLREHMHIHSDVCRFVCGFCNKGFKWKQPFEAHLNIHTGRTPYSCPWCPKTFANGSNCRIHKRKSHPVELAEYEAKNGICSEKVKCITSPENIVIRSIHFDDVVKSQVFPKIDNLNPSKSNINC